MPELVEFATHPIEYTDPKGNRLDVSRYVYQPFPKMVYRKDGSTKIVKDEAELKALPKTWSLTPFKRPLWDTRPQGDGFTLSEHHVAFLQAHGFDYKTPEEAKKWFDELPDAGKEAFLTDAAAWVPEEKKRGPGRPPKEPQAE